MKAVSLTPETFDSTLASTDVPILVDFWAEPCGPCRMLAPILDQLAAEQEGKAIVAKVDVGAHPELAERFGVRAVPTLLLFRGGDRVQTITGLKSKAFLETALHS